MNFWIGQHASTACTITDQDLAVISTWLRQAQAACAESAPAQHSQWAGQDVLLGGLIHALLTGCLPGGNSTLLSQQLEYLAPLLPGDTLTARVEVTAWYPEKRLLTLKTDCFNQSGRQVLTGQAVLAVTA